MCVFTEAEIAYLSSQRLGRLATVNAAGEPHLVPLAFFYNAALDVIEIGSLRPGMGVSRKFRDVAKTGRVAFLVDDIVKDPAGQQTGGSSPQLRAIEVRGEAEAHETGGEQLGPGFEPQFIRIRPRHVVSWGLNAPGYQVDSRTVR